MGRGSGSTDGATEWSPSRAAIEAVAESERIDPVDLPPLGDVIDPEALNGLFADRESTRGRIRFRYHGYEVTVDERGHVTLERSERVRS